jgi:hypothetical protein
MPANSPERDAVSVFHEALGAALACLARAPGRRGGARPHNWLSLKGFYREAG